MPQGLSAHRPTAYQARPGGRPVSRQTGPSAQKNIPASLLEGPSAAGSAAHPRAEAADGSRMVPWFRCNRCTPSPRRLHPVGALVAPRSGSGCICCTPMRQLSTASPTVAAGPGPGSAPKRSPRRSPDAAPQRCCPGAGRLASCLSFCLIHPRPGPFTSVRSDSVCAVRGRWRTPVNAGQHCWKACWGQPLRSSNLLSSATVDLRRRAWMTFARCATSPACVSFSVSVCVLAICLIPDKSRWWHAEMIHVVPGQGRRGRT